MQTPGNEPERAVHAFDPHPPREPRAMCPPTPPPEIEEAILCDNALTGRKDDAATDGNSATALDLGQERSMYVMADGAGMEAQESIIAVFHDNDKDMVTREAGLDIHTYFDADVTAPDELTLDSGSMPTPQSVMMDGAPVELFQTRLSEPMTTQIELDHKDAGKDPHGVAHVKTDTSDEQDFRGGKEVESVSDGDGTSLDQTRDSNGSSDFPTTPRFNFSDRRLYPHYPSSFLRPGSKFSGTQQSDRQIYNVDVEVLTLSVPESTMTGYLRICGLTEDHPTLTTFFTGEIIGGPTHKHTFQTKDPTWGATDRTDLQHWAQFPAWRSLSKDAKRDINFKYPPPVIGIGSQLGPSPSTSVVVADEVEGASEADDNTNPGWWTQPNVFMRWKEWFLVPDHRVRSIQGASFEGFYYICFNQTEGRINGIYFHARSER